MRNRCALAVACLLSALGCPKPSTSSDGGPSAVLPAQLAFTGTEDHFLFSYVDAAGNVKSVDKLADVPVDRRKNLMVVDLSKSPEERQSDRYVFFSDATVKDPEGRFVAAAVSRYQPTSATPAGTAADTFTADTQSKDVVVYSAEWCGYCKKTKAFLKQKGIPFRERDVEKDTGADRELQAKARKAGVRVSGVPVTDFMGELVMGFDQARLERLIGTKVAAKPVTP
jgi:glutaredoxin